MRLEIGAFHVKDIQFGDHTGYKAGILTVSKEELLTFSLEGYAATPENVAAKNYPLGTQGFVVIRSDEPADSPARRLFDWFGSPLSDLILTRNGVTPLHDS